MKSASVLEAFNPTPLRFMLKHKKLDIWGNHTTIYFKVMVKHIFKYIVSGFDEDGL